MTLNGRLLLLMAKVKTKPRAFLSDGLAIVGACLVITGAGKIYEPLGYIIAGVAFLVFAYAWSGDEDTPTPPQPAGDET